MAQCAFPGPRQTPTGLPSEPRCAARVHVPCAVRARMFRMIFFNLDRTAKYDFMRWAVFCEAHQPVSFQQPLVASSSVSTGPPRGKRIFPSRAA